MIYELTNVTGMDNRRSLTEITVNEIMCDAISYYLNNYYRNEYLKLLVIPTDDRKKEISKIRYHAKRCGFRVIITKNDQIIRLSMFNY